MLQNMFKGKVTHGNRGGYFGSLATAGLFVLGKDRSRC